MPATLVHFKYYRQILAYLHLKQALTTICKRKKNKNNISQPCMGNARNTSYYRTIVGHSDDVLIKSTLWSILRSMKTVFLVSTYNLVYNLH